jgi:DNA-binding NarL/FixJ family response regulator
MTIMADNPWTVPQSPWIKVTGVSEKDVCRELFEQLWAAGWFAENELLLEAVRQAQAVRAVPAPRSPEPLPEPLSQAEARVLRFLQTSLSVPEIARELYVSVNTIRTHTRHLYDKLGAHRRLEAVDRARALGILTPRPQRA